MRNAASSVEKLDRILLVLEDLSKSATKLKKRFKERMTVCSSQYGFAKLPDEIIVKILEITCDSWLLTRPRYQQSNEQLKMLSLVCRRFRDVVNSHAHFWTKLSNAWESGATTMALKRSKGLSLELSLYDEGGYFIGPFLRDTLHLQFERFRSIHIEFANYERLPAKWWTHIRGALEVLGSANLPALEYFHMGVPTFAGYFPLNGEPDKDDFCIYRTWNAPSLKYLGIEGLIPIPHESLNLRRLGLCFDRFDKYSGTEGRLSELLNFLSSQPRLRHLNLILGGLKIEEADKQRKATVHLPKLTSLSLQSASPEYLPVQILSALSTPAVEFMDMKMDLDRYSATLEEVFQCTYPSMKRLHLLVWMWSGAPLVPFKTIFTKFPNLEVLRFSTRHPVDGEFSTLPSVVPPPLRVMELINCEGLGVEALKQVLDVLKQGPHWDVFESLEIWGCPEIETHLVELYSVVPASKVTLRRRAPDGDDYD
jgi:hypothetical protein